MSRGRKVTLQLEVFESNAEGPAEWFPSITKEAALALVDRQIEQAQASMNGLLDIRAIIESADGPRQGEGHE